MRVTQTAERQATFSALTSQSADGIVQTDTVTVFAKCEEALVHTQTTFARKPFCSEVPRVGRTCSTLKSSSANADQQLYPAVAQRSSDVREKVVLKTEDEAKVLAHQIAGHKDYEEHLSKTVERIVSVQAVDLSA